MIISGTEAKTLAHVRGDIVNPITFIKLDGHLLASDVKWQRSNQLLGSSSGLRGGFLRGSFLRGGFFSSSFRCGGLVFCSKLLTSEVNNGGHGGGRVEAVA